MTRRLVARLWRCVDDDCNCVQPMIREEWGLGDGFNSEIVWEGEFYSDPSPMELQFAYEELEGAAYKHNLERDDWSGTEWSREI